MVFKKIKQRGVTLFEMMLVLLVMAMLAVAAIRYADRQRDEAVADRLAEKLYFWGQAVREYAFDNQDEIEAGTLFDMSPRGVDWLKEAMAGLNETQEPYIEDSFTLMDGMEPLFVGRQNGGVGVPATDTDLNRIRTTFSWNVANDRPEITIRVGKLYDPSTGVDDTGNPNPPEAMMDITQEAARKASEYHDPVKGAPAIRYVLNINDPAFPNIGVLGTLSHTATETEDYLRIDGLNYMKDNLDFIDADVHGGVTEAQDNYGIRYIESIAFDNNAINANISQLKVLDFHSGMGIATTINNLDNLNFDSSSVAAINNLDSLSFKGSAALLTLITNLNVLNFKQNSTTSIDGLDNLNFKTSAAMTKVTQLTDLEFKPTASSTNVKNLITLDFKAGATTTINNLGTLNFVATGTPNTVTQLKNFQLLGGAIPGMGTYTVTAARAPGAGNNGVTRTLALIATNRGFCYVNGFNIDPNVASGAGNNNYICSVLVAGGMWTLYAQINSSNSQNDDHITCSAACIQLN